MTIATLVHNVKAALRPKEVAVYCGIGESTVWWLAANDPTFPKKIKLGSRTTVFMRVDVDKWLASKAGGSK